MTYNYLDAIISDVLDHISENIDMAEYEGKRDELETELYDTLWTEDHVTGNGSGSYTFSRFTAEEYLAHNLDLLADALDEFGFEGNPLAKGAEWCDVTIRCYLLAQAINEALNGIESGEYVI